MLRVKVERKELIFPGGFKPWYKDFEDELLTFPHSQFKDQCDALSQALQYLEENRNMLSTNIPIAVRTSSYEYTGPSNLACTGREASLSQFSSSTTPISSRGDEPYGFPGKKIW